MSFGFSVGDIIAVADLANKIRQRFVDSPEQFKAIAIEVRGLSIVLQDADIILPEKELTSQQKAELDGIMQGCHDLLIELKLTLDKYQELDLAKGSNGRSRKVWKRLTWDQKDIDGFRGRISSNILLLNTFLELINSQAIFSVKDGVDRLNLGQQEHEQKEEHQAITKWLSLTDYASQQSDFMARCEEGTGKWLLNSNEFQQWLNQNQQILFCPGMPGAGKTMIASIVIDHLYAKYETDSRVGIAYLYCNFRRQDEQKPVDLLASLLKRLVQGRPTLPNSLRDLYGRCKNKQSRPSFEEISKELHSIIASFSTTFIVIDALDECQVSDGGQTKFLSEILRLQTKTRANLLVTSRFIPHIVTQFQGAASLEIRASNGDVQRYVDGQLSRLPSFVRRNLDIQEQVKTEIVKAVDGMFLLAQLHLESLIGKRSPKALRAALEKLPTGSEAYDYAYKEAMERIEGQHADSKELAKQALAWITCSKRPLTTLELQHALAVEIGESSIDEENIPEIEDVVSVCAGLVTVDEGNGIVRLVHYTTQEYFERTWNSWFDNALEDIAKTCVAYMLFSTFQTGFCATDDEFEARLRLNPLYDYAARNWAYYACVGSIEVEELILYFLQNDVAVSASSQAAIAIWEYYEYSRVPEQMRGMHLAAYFGLEKWIAKLLKRGYNPDSKDTDGRTPLSYAAENGNEAIVKLLLATAGVDADSNNVWKKTPLSLAAENGHESVVKLLLATVGVNAEALDCAYYTPLAHAASKGHEAIVKLLLATASVDVNRPLSLAALYGHEVVVKMLLATAGVDADYIIDNKGESTLSHAASNGHEEVVKLLLNTGNVNVNSKNYRGETPLSWAAHIGHDAVVKLLIAVAGIDIDSKDNNGETPLWGAAKCGNEEVVKLLLATGNVNAHSMDNSGLTPLAAAAKYGHEVIVKLLLATDGADADSKDWDCDTPLSLAAMNGHKEVVKLLLATAGVVVNSKNSDCGTPLSLAATNGHEAVVRLLLTTAGIDVDSRDNYGDTPLSLAAENGHVEVVKLLLAISSLDASAALYSAASKGHEAIVKLLLATASVDVNRPLCSAASGGHEEVVKLLLATGGVDVNSRDNYGDTPLSLAASGGNEEVVKLLLATAGVDMNSKTIEGDTPLLLAVSRGHQGVERLLLATAGVDVNYKNIQDNTALFAARYELEQLVRRMFAAAEARVRT
ncbi:hypothetical protein V493_05229 [Pseudogymnoascus sp. VKM F-4281 (FW-2241)]|nr:hypothetical protein V493_05229 [Pseudogymnoascus sp. VKM F-4281 (FW-2241)]